MGELRRLLVDGILMDWLLVSMYIVSNIIVLSIISSSSLFMGWSGCFIIVILFPVVFVLTPPNSLFHHQSSPSTLSQLLLYPKIHPQHRHHRPYPLRSNLPLLHLRERLGSRYYHLLLSLCHPLHNLCWIINI